MKTHQVNIPYRLKKGQAADCFKNSFPVDMSSIISQVLYFIHCCAGLQRTEVRDRRFGEAAAVYECLMRYQ